MSFSSFSSLATKPTGIIHFTCSLAEIFSMIPLFISFFTFFLTFSEQGRGVFLGFLEKKSFAPGCMYALLGIVCFERIQALLPILTLVTIKDRAMLELWELECVPLKFFWSVWDLKECE